MGPGKWRTPGAWAAMVIVSSLATSPSADAGTPQTAARGLDATVAPAVVLIGEDNHGGRGGKGVGRALGILGGAVILGKALEARQQREKHKPDRKPHGGKIVVKVPVDHDDVACKGGHVRSGKCVCGRGDSRTKIGRNAYVCIDRGPPVETAEPVDRDDVACKGGHVRSGKCVCGRGDSRTKIGRNAYACVDRDPPVDTAEPAVPERGKVPKREPEPRKTPPPDTPLVPAVQPAPPPAAGDGEREFAADEVLVTFASSTPESVERAVARDFGLEARDRFESSLIGSRIVLYRITNGRSVDAVLSAMRPDGRVQEPQENKFYRHQGGPGDVLSGNELQYALTKVEAPEAHVLAHGRGALVAVIDSAVDARHPDLESAIAGIYDATGEAEYTPDAHGTAVAGILKARGTVRGIAPEARLLAVRAFKARGKGQTAVTTSFILLRGLDWAIGQNARVLNLSFVGPHDPLVARAIRAAQNRRAIIVAAAGNNGPGAPPAYPAAYDEVIAVTATDAADQLYTSANQGEYIAVAAPGVDVLVLGTDGGHEFQSGTSFAAPHVTGIIALMLEHNPLLTGAEARRALAAAAEDLGTPGKDHEFGAGRVNAKRALRLLEPATARAP